MLRIRTPFLTTLALIAFAGNSLFCRLALKTTSIDATSFTTIRLISGSLVLWLILQFRGGQIKQEGNWTSGMALFVYAAGFSFAYRSLPTATGALLLFGAVQATMIGFGIWAGERFLKVQFMGLVIAFSGIIVLLLPGISAPPLQGSLLMLCAGTAWGVYSLRGKGQGDPVRVTAGNFLRAAPLSIVLSLFMFDSATLDRSGFWYAVLSGALASAIGYCIWYTALPSLKATNAATVQLSVPVIAAAGGIVFLGETITVRLFLASIAILGGIAMVVMKRQPAQNSK
ncbi:drug/metabolite transporter (DMT)-like permease [Oxalobacteraceae bacterium GrIS 1.18]